jgi:hypothetical protein
LSVKLTGIEDVKAELNRLKRLKNDYRKLLKEFMVKMANELIKRVKARTPFDTGNLLDSWHVGEPSIKGNKVSVKIWNDAKKGVDYIAKYGEETAYYASFVEYGHRGVYSYKLGVTVNKDTAYTNGVYMLTSSVNEIKRIINKEYELFFEDLLKVMGL